MANCTSCGMEIPEGQKICSMCYGDVSYGGDGYYQAYMEEWERQSQMEPEPEPEVTDE